VDDFFSNVTYLNKIKYYDYSKAKLLRANRFLDYVKHTFHPLVQYEKQIKNGEANLCWSFSRNDVGDPLT
jgi:hypothetical protein